MRLRFPEEEGGVSFVRIADQEVIDHYGDPPGEYRAALEKAVVRDRSHRARWRIAGKQSEAMLQGVVSGVMPRPPEEVEPDLAAGRAHYQTVLTPKGRMISDLRLWREPDADGVQTFLADVPLSGSQALRDHFKRVLPPRLARVTEVTGETGMISVMGPDAARIVSGVVLGLRLGSDELEALEEGEYRILDSSDGDRIQVLRSGDVSLPSFDLIATREVARAVWRHLTAATVRPVGRRIWEILRVEAGRPDFGADLTDQVIPTEAGIEDRAIDHTKGCYTGQEVIVRIRDRGHVNRHLRRLVLDPGAPLPLTGTELFREGGKPAGLITTVVNSPRRGKLALAYVRREVEPGGEVAVGAEDGPRARVEALEALDGD